MSDEKSYVNPCLNCPPIPKIAPMAKLIAVGFGFAVVLCDGEEVYDGEAALRADKAPWTFADAEEAALVDPDSKWEVVLHGPLHGETYERQGVGRWVLTERNRGFA